MRKHGILLQYILVLPIFYKQLIQISIGCAISGSRQVRGLEPGDPSYHPPWTFPALSHAVLMSLGWGFGLPDE